MTHSHISITSIVFFEFRKANCSEWLFSFLQCRLMQKPDLRDISNMMSGQEMVHVIFYSNILYKSENQLLFCVFVYFKLRSRKNSLRLQHNIYFDRFSIKCMNLLHFHQDSNYFTVIIIVIITILSEQELKHLRQSILYLRSNLSSVNNSTDNEFSLGRICGTFHAVFPTFVKILS